MIFIIINLESKTNAISVGGNPKSRADLKQIISEIKHIFWYGWNKFYRKVVRKPIHFMTENKLVMLVWFIFLSGTGAK